MSTQTAAAPTRGTRESSAALAERMRLEVQHSVQRGIRGMELLGAPPPRVGVTPKTLLHSRGTMQLVHYHPLVDEIYRIPLLIVMAPTNKGFILDLTPGQSLVEYLLLKGYDVYMIDWVDPAPEESELDLDDYALDFIPDCISKVQEESGEEDVNLVGYCAGGMLSSIYMALTEDTPVKNLVCFTTPVDFSQMEIFQSLTSKEAFDLEEFLLKHPVIPGDQVAAGFDALRPAARVTGQIRLWDNLWNDEFVNGFRMMERWGNETLPLPRGYFRQTTQKLMRENALFNGTLNVGGRVVDLSKITVPLLHVVAKYDHIVPPDCSKPLVERVGSEDKTEISLPGGHVSIAAGKNAIKRMWPALDSWLEGRSI